MLINTPYTFKYRFFFFFFFEKLDIHPGTLLKKNVKEHQNQRLGDIFR